MFRSIATIGIVASALGFPDAKADVIILAGGNGCLAYSQNNIDPFRITCKGGATIVDRTNKTIYTCYLSPVVKYDSKLVGRWSVKVARPPTDIGGYCYKQLKAPFSFTSSLLDVRQGYNFQNVHMGSMYVVYTASPLDIKVCVSGATVQNGVTETSCNQLEIAGEY